MAPGCELWTQRRSLSSPKPAWLQLLLWSAIYTVQWLWAWTWEWCPGRPPAHTPQHGHPSRSWSIHSGEGDFESFQLLFSFPCLCSHKGGLDKRHLDNAGKWWLVPRTKEKGKKRKKTDKYICVARQQGWNWKTKSCCAVHPKANELMCNHLDMSHGVWKKTGNRSWNCETHSHASQKPVLGESKIMSKVKFGEDLAMETQTNGKQLCRR